MNLDAAMRLAVEHADRVKGTTYPNPPVGAVILDREGEIAVSYTHLTLPTNREV